MINIRRRKIVVWCVADGSKKKNVWLAISGINISINMRFNHNHTLISVHAKGAVSNASDLCYEITRKLCIYIYISTPDLFPYYICIRDFLLGHGYH